MKTYNGFETRGNEVRLLLRGVCVLYGCLKWVPGAKSWSYMIAASPGETPSDTFGTRLTGGLWPVTGSRRAMRFKAKFILKLQREMKKMLLEVLE